MLHTFPAVSLACFAWWQFPPKGILTSFGGVRDDMARVVSNKDAQTTCRANKQEDSAYGGRNASLGAGERCGLHGGHRASG